MGVYCQKTNLPVSPPAAHWHFLPLSAAALIVCNRICYEMAETGVRSWRLVGGSQQKAAAYLTVSHRPLWLLVVIRQATAIAIAAHHRHSLLSAAICQETMMGGETYLHHCPPPPPVVDDFGGKTYLRSFPAANCQSFCHRPPPTFATGLWTPPSTPVNCSGAGLERKGEQKHGWENIATFFPSCGCRGGSGVGLHTCCRRPSSALPCYHKPARGAADPNTSRWARNPPLLAWRHQWSLYFLMGHISAPEATPITK